MKTLKNSNRLVEIEDLIERSSNRLARTNDNAEKETIRKKLSYFYNLVSIKKQERKEEGLKQNQEFF